MQDDSGSAPTIVCAVHDGQDAVPALHFATSLALGLGRPLAIILVNRTRPASGYPDLRDYTAAEAETLLSQAADEARRLGARPRLVLKEGRDVVDTLLEATKQLGGDHIVVGSGALSGLGRFLLGSVAAGVANRAECTVTIARAADSPEGQARGAGSTGRRGS